MQNHWLDWLLELGDIFYIYTRVRRELDFDFGTGQNPRTSRLPRNRFTP